MGENNAIMLSAKEMLNTLRAIVSIRTQTSTENENGNTFLNTLEMTPGTSGGILIVM